MIDLRSDTVTLPTPPMREAMANAVLGDDVYGEDPTVKRLEALAAERLGKEAALYVSSGTQSNLCALLVHCQRGEEFIAGQDAHIYKYEAGGGAVLGSIQPQPIEQADDGRLPIEAIAARIKPLDDSHLAVTRLIALENTWNGKPLPRRYIETVKSLADQHRLALHIDGARLFNAAAALGVDAMHLAEPADTVSICLSKGLSAPIGSVLCGSHNAIAEARRWRKMLGGGMRQAGVVAAAGIVALETMTERLSDDHARAEKLADALRQQGRFEIDGAFTNMVFVETASHLQAALVEHLAACGVCVAPGRYATMRLVFHADINDDDLGQVINAFDRFDGSDTTR
ncbi:low-specificity L-threonine aldolase [Gammaproteobacteria bacterium]|nr:low-specificity L-threonine aldolase [Gammaproteobacteria bacterium]